MNEKATVGRASECDLVVDQSYGRVSNEHATLMIQDGQLVFKDHSSNGTTINGRQIHNASIAIQNGDKILLADSYELSWPTILHLFPGLQRRTERFDGSQISSSERRTEMFAQSSKGMLEHHHTESEASDSSTLRENAGQLNDYTQSEMDEFLEKFNIGAFLSSWVWAACNRIYWPLIIIPVSLIPYLGQVASLFLCAYLGINGTKMAWSKSTVPFGTFMVAQTKWIGIGVILFLIFAVIQIFALYNILS